MDEFDICKSRICILVIVIHGHIIKFGGVINLFTQSRYSSNDNDAF